MRTCLWMSRKHQTAVPIAAKFPPAVLAAKLLQQRALRRATFRDQSRCARTSNNPDCKARDGHRLCCRDQGLLRRLPSMCNRSPPPTQISFNACAHRSCRPSRRAIQTSLSPRLTPSFHRRRTAVPPQPHRPRRYLRLPEGAAFPAPHGW